MFPTIDKQATGKKIQKIMELNHISVKQLQEYLHLSCVQSIYHWLNGISMPTIDNLYVMSRLFEIPIDFMVCGNVERMPATVDDKENAFYNRMKKYYLKVQEYWAA